MRPSHAFEQPSDFLPIFSSEEWVGQQEKLYTEAGVTPTSIKAHLERILSIPPKERDFLQNEDSFYLNSSDSLPDLVNAIDVRGKRVLSVAASGDFAQIFFFGGAQSVELFDISPLAALWTELRMTAAALLSYSEYKDFFTDRLTIRRETNTFQLDPSPLFDILLYKKIRQGLTAQAQTAFDLLTSPRFRELFIVDKIVDAAYGFARPRHLHFVHDVLDEQLYQVMQDALVRGRFSIHIEEADEATKRASTADVVYLSNIGYEAHATVRLATRFYQEGVRRVVFNLCPGTIREISVFDGSSARRSFLDLRGQIFSPQRYQDVPDTSRELFWNIETNKPVFPGDVFLMRTGREPVPVRLMSVCQESLRLGGINYTILAELA